MKFNILINQKRISEIAPNLDLADCVVLDYLYYACNSLNPKVVEKRVDGYTWITLQQLIEEMPLLRIKSKTALTPRINRLKEAGLIEIIRPAHQKLYVRFTPKIDGLFRELSSSTNSSIQFDEQSYPVLRTNNIKNDNTKNDNDKLTTNVVNWGNPDINAGICLLKESGITTSKEKLNRYALQRLYKKHGIDKTLGVMKYALAVRGQPYAPIITSYLDLESKWDKLEAFGVRQKNERRQHGAIDASDL